MKTKKYWIWVIVSFSILVVLWPALQITGETGLSAKEKETYSNLTALYKSASSAEPAWANKKEVLQGLQGVRVLVGDIKPEVEKYGLTEKSLQTDTELQLRLYGIKVFTLEERLSTPGLPILGINVNVVIDEEDLTAAVVINVELRENVLLLRDPPRICLAACTWNRASVLTGGVKRIKDLREDVKDFVNEFINDYLAANPKDHSTKKKGSIFDDLKKPKDN